MFADWVAVIPHIIGDFPNADGIPAPFDREQIFPSAFRNSYAQRHADS